MAETRTITEGPFWALMLPDGRLAGKPCPMLLNDMIDTRLLAEATQGRVVRVRSVTYEVEVE